MRRLQQSHALYATTWQANSYNIHTLKLLQHGRHCVAAAPGVMAWNAVPQSQAPPSLTRDMAPAAGTAIAVNKITVYCLHCSMHLAHIGMGDGLEKAALWGLVRVCVREDQNEMENGT